MFKRKKQSSNEDHEFNFIRERKLENQRNDDDDDIFDLKREKKEKRPRKARKTSLTTTYLISSELNLKFISSG